MAKYNDDVVYDDKNAFIWDAEDCYMVFLKSPDVDKRVVEKINCLHAAEYKYPDGRVYNHYRIAKEDLIDTVKVING